MDYRTPGKDRRSGIDLFGVVDTVVESLTSPQRIRIVEFEEVDSLRVKILIFDL